MTQDTPHSSFIAHLMSDPDRFQKMLTDNPDLCTQFQQFIFELTTKLPTAAEVGKLETTLNEYITEQKQERTNNRRRMDVIQEQAKIAQEQAEGAHSRIDSIESGQKSMDDKLDLLISLVKKDEPSKSAISGGFITTKNLIIALALGVALTVGIAIDPDGTAAWVRSALGAPMAEKSEP